MFKLCWQETLSKQSLRALAVSQDSALVAAARQLYQINLLDRTSHKVFLSHNIYCVQHDINTQVMGLAGCQDGTLNFISKGLLHFPLKAHEKTINSVVVYNGEIVTGSWDGTFKVWKNKAFPRIPSSKLILGGADFSLLLENQQWTFIQVQASKYGVELGVAGQNLVACSVQGDIMLWNQSIIKSIKGHQQAVRGVRPIQGVGFLTISNDELVKIWAQDLEPIDSLSGHSSFIFGAAVKDLGYYYTCGQDRNLIVWNNHQHIVHPSTIWAVCLHRGDVLTACADGTLRRFSTDPSKQASQEQQTAFSSLGELNKASTVGLSQAQLKSMPSTANLDKIKGKKQGQYKIFNQNGTATAYLWHQQSQSWQKIGEVLSQAASKKKFAGDQYFPAGQYQQILEVELQGISRSLPFNSADDYDDSAQRFCKREGLSKAYVSQIRNFMAQQVPQKKQKKQEQVKEEKMEVELQRLPDCQLVQFLGGNADGMHKKILQFNEKCQGPAKLSASQQFNLKLFVEAVKNDRFRSIKMQDGVIDLISKLVYEWDLALKLPVYDMLRLWSLHFQGQGLFAALNSGTPIILQLCQHVSKLTPVYANLSLKTLCNIFSSSSGKYSMFKNYSLVFAALQAVVNKPLQEPIQVGLSSLLKNYAITVYQRTANQEMLDRIINLIKTSLQNFTSGNHQRLLASAGMILLKHKDKRAVFTMLKNFKSEEEQLLTQIKSLL